MKTWKILLVDDDPEDRAIIQDAMEMIDAGELIRFAENGEQVMPILNDRLEANRLPCLVVLDLNMPRMNGTETLRVMKDSEHFRNIPVIIYSTSINPLEKEKCMSLGAYDYITKPVSFKESKAIAQRLLNFTEQSH